MACHLLKAVEGGIDMGLGAFELGYLRDREKREIDFPVVRDGAPWLRLMPGRSPAAARGDTPCSSQIRIGVCLVPGSGASAGR